MRILVAVISYFPDMLKGCHEAIRKGWGKDVAPADLRFFMPTLRWQNGEKIVLPEGPSDEIRLDVSDAYDRIQHEVREILRWSINQGYAFTFLACNDTFINFKKLLTSGFERYDYFGTCYPSSVVPGETFSFKFYEKTFPNMFSWMDGGIGYFVSKKAAELIVKEESNEWTADIHHGQILGPKISTNEISAGLMPMTIHYQHKTDEKRYDGVIEWQRKMYEKYK
jgi:hypothetical protein